MGFISFETITTHSHALSIFILYLFMRYYRASKFVGPDLDKDDGPSVGLTKPKRNAPISYGKAREIESSSTLTSSSSSITIDKIPYDHDDAKEFVEIGSSLELESNFIERRRFLVACKGNVAAATNRLNEYLHWNKKHLQSKTENNIHIKPTRDRDYDLWVESCLTAMNMSGEIENIVLPRVIRQIQLDSETMILDREGYRVFCMRPALMDTKLANASTYALAVAIYLDRSNDRESPEKLNVCVDVRAGRGWPNTHVLKLIPFMKECMKLLLPLFPERLHRALVYPVPHAFYYVWTMISKCMDPLTVERVCIISGQCKIEAPPPDEKLKKYFGEQEVERLEACRVNNFR